MKPKAITLLRRSALLFALLLLLHGGMLAFATEGANDSEQTEEPENSENVLNPCASMEELLAYLADEAVLEITLTEDLVVAQPTQLQADHEITVYMGYHCILLEAPLSISSPMHFIGEGGEWESAKFILSEETLTTTSEVWIEAVGDDAVAVRSYFDGGVLGSEDGDIYITANGQGSVALSAQGKLTCYRLALTAGNGYAAEVDRLDDVEFIDCTLNGEIWDWEMEPNDDGGHSNAIPDYILENPESYFVQWGQDYNVLRYGLWFAEGEELLLPEYITMLFLYVDDGGFGAVAVADIPVVWEDCGSLPSTPGSYTVTAIPMPNDPSVALENLVHGERYEVAVHIVPPLTQHLTSALKTVNWDGRPCIALDLVYSLDGTEDYRLWVRTADGDWEGCTMEDGNTEYRIANWESLRLGVCFIGADFDLDYEFKLEVIDGPMAGMTNTISVPGGIEFYSGGQGGDRDGTGQSDQGERPPASPSPPNWDGDDTPLAPAPAPPEDGDAVQDEQISNPPDAALPEPPEENVVIESPPAPAQSLPTLSADTDATTAPPEPEADPEPEAIPVYEAAPVQDAPASLPPEAPLRPQPVTLEKPMLEALLEASPRELTFIENGIKLILPTALLSELALGPEESLTVVLALTADGFAVYLHAGAREITGLTESFLIHVPYDGNQPCNQIYCTDAGGETYYAQGSENGKLIFSLSRTGSYVLYARESAPAEPDIPTFSAAIQAPTEMIRPAVNGAGTIDDEESTPLILSLILGCVLVSPPVVLLARRRGRSGKRDE